MRKITFCQILVFQILLLVTIVLAVSSTWFLLSGIQLGDFRGVVMVGAGLVFVYLYAFAVYRLFLLCMPLAEGEAAEGSRAEFAAHVNNLFYLVLFHTLIRTHFLPIPLMRWVYLALGARMGKNTYSTGVILDPPFVQFGANCIIGHDAVLFSHAIEGRYLAFLPIQVGDNVTIGATAVIMPGVSIGDGAIVSAGAVVLKNTRIGPGEVWGGVPAKRIR